MKNIFNSILLKRPAYNRFDLSHDVKLSLNMGRLVPICCLDCIPGDKFTLGCESLLRFAPLIAPVMHRFDVTMHYFFVPYRILWENFEKWMTGGSEPGNWTDPANIAFPFITINGGNETTLSDYLGIPPIATAGNTGSENVSALPFAAYQMIWDHYYRDQNLQDSFQMDASANPPWYVIDGDNTPNAANLMNLRLRAWEHDYFTAGLPQAQKGAQVTIPIGGFNNVPITAHEIAGGTSSVVSGIESPGGAVGYSIDIDNVNNPDDGTLYAKTQDLLQSEATISDLRRATKLQEFLEKAARGGTRYTELIRSFFGVTSSDKRLQRPEYITGTKSPVVISEVLQTGQPTTESDLPQGNMSGHGFSVTSGKYGRYFCEEHGLIMGIMSVMPKTAYQQGIPKHFLKINDRYERFFNEFAHIGEQPVLNKELYAFQGGDGDDTFAYVPRYSEYKYEPNRVAGEFRTTLDFWTAARIFGTPPQLNQDFIMCLPDTRNFAVAEGDTLYAQVLNHVTAARMMPKYGNPHFG